MRLRLLIPKSPLFLSSDTDTPKHVNKLLYSNTSDYLSRYWNQVLFIYTSQKKDKTMLNSLAFALVDSIENLRVEVIEKWATDNLSMMLVSKNKRLRNLAEKFSRGQNVLNDLEEFVREFYDEDPDCQILGDKQDGAFVCACREWEENNKVTLAVLSVAYRVQFPDLSKTDDDDVLICMGDYECILRDIAEGYKLPQAM